MPTSLFVRGSLVGVAAAVLCVSAGVAGAAPIYSSLADYEPRLVRPNPSPAGEQLAIDPAIDTPSDAANLRVGGQSRFRIGSAYFFALPTLTPGQTISGASLAFTQIPDTAAATAAFTPQFNADLRVVGITQDISVANDPDTSRWTRRSTRRSASSLRRHRGRHPRPARHDRAAAGAPGQLPDAGAVPRAGLRRQRTAAERRHGQRAAAGLPQLALRGRRPVGQLSDRDAQSRRAAGRTLTNRYQFASSNVADNAQRPTLHLDVVPEPGSLSLLAVAAARRSAGGAGSDRNVNGSSRTGPDRGDPALLLCRSQTHFPHRNRIAKDFLPLPVLRERVGVRVMPAALGEEPSPLPSPGVPGEGRAPFSFSAAAGIPSGG